MVTAVACPTVAAPGTVSVGKALNALQHSSPDQAIPMLRQLLQGTQSLKLKERALFVLAQSRSPEARTILTERNEELRGEAVRQLGVMSAHDELWQLYQKETSVAVKRQILQAMFVGGNATRLIELAKTEPNAELRRTAVRNLGLMRTSATGPALVEFYTSQKEAEVRSAAVQGLFVQNNAEALIALARRETDPAMKKELVQRLSLMGKSKVAMDYLREVLGK